MEDLTEVITAAEFHPKNCSDFLYSTSKGVVRLCDMRERALCDQHAKGGVRRTQAWCTQPPCYPAHTAHPHCVCVCVCVSEIIASISDVKFSHCGRYFLTRDFLTLKLWDLNMERGPLETYHMHDYLRSKLCSLYENDFIFDRFECGWNGSDRCVPVGP